MTDRAKPLVGAAIAAVLAVIAIAIAVTQPQTAWPLATSLLVAGAPVGIVLGWRFAGRTGRWNPAALVAWMAASAVLLGDAEISAGVAVGGIVSGDLGVTAFAALAFVAGLIVGLAVLPLTAVAAIIWLVTFKAVDGLVATRKPSGVTAAAVVGITTMVIVIIALSQLTLGQPDQGEAGSVRLRWTVVNQGAHGLELGTFESEPDGFGGSVAEIDPCFTSIGQTRIGTAWFLTLDPGLEAADPAALVSADDAPGADVSVWIDIASDGERTVAVGREPPPPEQLTVDHCFARSAP
jgi:hypothetical protein